MTDQGLIAALRRNMVETGSLICLGCGHEHSCSAHGCAIMREAADALERLGAENAALRARTEQATPQTNFARLTRSPEALAEFLMEAQKSDPARKWCVDEACREHPDDEQFDCTDEMHTRCILKWLNTHDGLF